MHSPIHAFLFDHLREKGGVGSAKDRKDTRQLRPDAPVLLQVPQVRSGIDGVAQHVGPQAQRRVQRVLFGRHHQADLVAGLLQQAADEQDALRLVIDLFDNETECANR